MISLALPLSAQTTPAPAAPATPATAPKTAVDTATDKAAAAANKATGKAKDAAKGAKDKADKATAAVKAVPFYGEVAAVDAAAKTVTIGENVYQVSATTVIHNADKPAKFEDVVVGKKIGGNYKTVEGKKEIVKLNVGVKQESAKPAPKAKADDKAKPAAPAPAADASKKKAA
jgi:hypothetical protein